uniref:Ig-like domain-containing protein n=1 Tax=Equus asinus asinus TaxID=83772 RepID=A0A8C4LW68_EQUAS
MLSASCSGLVILLMLRGTNGDSVTQTEGPVILPEGAPLTLNCTYQSSYSFSLFWYVQYQNKEPQLLLKSSSENQGADSRGFQATLNRSDSSFHLQKPSVQVSDSAVYYCALRDTVRGIQGELSTNPEGAGGPGCGSPGRGVPFSPVFCAGGFLTVLPALMPQSQGALEFLDESAERN